MPGNQLQGKSNAAMFVFRNCSPFMEVNNEMLFFQGGGVINKQNYVERLDVM